MTNTATQKQVNYLLKLGATAEEIKDLTIKAASIMISKLLKKQKENNNNNVIKKEKAAATAKPIEFEHGYKVGDILYSSWGYEQTNLDFFQVVAVTEKSIRIKEVVMDVKEEEYMSHGMAKDVSYKPETARIVTNSHWIKDNEKGDIRKIKVYEYNGNKNYYVRLSNYASLCRYNGEKLYNSWYY